MSEFPRELLDDLIDDLDVAVFFADSEGIVRYLNEPAAYIVRLPSLTAIGSPLDRILPQDVAHFLSEKGNEALATGRTQRMHRKSLILPGRGLLFFDIRITPYRRTEGGPWTAYLLLDITAQERRKIANDRARENAEAEARARRSFLARMSHEIRTPMNGIMGMTDLALNSEDRADIEEYLGVIRNASDSLLGIINDVLDFSKIESGRLEPEQIALKPAELLDDVLALLRPAADEKGIRLNGKVEESVPETIVGDPVRIRQILTNLIGNALKFTEKGSINVGLSIRESALEQTDGSMMLTGTVRDTGIGIEPEKLESLFEPFAQSEATTSREFGGTGLGLAICRTLARLMGGDVDAESIPGQGSVFSFRIMVKTSDQAEKTGRISTEKNRVVSGDIPRWNGEKVLLAEDNRVNRIIAEKLLQRVGLEPLSCENGLEAVEIFEREKPVLILMDLQMPVMNGTDASRKIRDIEQSENRPAIPIVALTAHVLEDERKEAEEAGMNGWVTKPVKPEDLYAELARLLPPVISPE